MDFGQIITCIMLVFALIGAADRCLGCKFGPGKSFEEGFSTMGPLVLAMVGINTVVPLISKYLSPVLAPMCASVGLDPSFVAGILLANDCGGWPLALALGQDELIAKFMGSIVGSVMGCTLIFTIPFAFSSGPKEKRPEIAKGLIIGLITIPVSCFIGGLLMGINIVSLFINILPLIILAGIFVIGLKFFEAGTVKFITIFGYILTALITISLAIAIVIKQLNFDVPDLAPFDECIYIIGGIAIVLSGAFTMLFFIKKFFGKGLTKIGEKIGINQTSVIGIITSLVNSIPIFGMMKDMDSKGVIINTAFAVSASFALGDHMAYAASTDSSVVLPLVVGKVIGGAVAIIIALFVTKEKKEVTKN